MPNTISPAELQELKQKNPGLKLLDVRTPAEYQDVHVEYAINEPLERLQPEKLRESDQYTPQQPLYVICQSGSRGNTAAEKFQAAGFQEVFNVAGGTKACLQAGLPVVRGKAMMSLERQVRIVAGLLVVIGTVLSLTVHPYWVGLSAFVGAGLVFAGLTDTCGMAMILAKMPWNQANFDKNRESCAT